MKSVGDILTKTQLVTYKGLQNEKTLKFHPSAVFQGLLKGESTYKVADRIQQITGSSRNTALRNARTAIGSAQNAGIQSTFERAAAMGIEIVKEWKCFHDARTRDSHAALDGVRVPYDEPFPNGRMYPKDPDGEPAEVYNCRCVMGRVRAKSEPRTDHTPESYRKWKEEKENAKNEFNSRADEGIIKPSRTNSNEANRQKLRGMLEDGSLRNTIRAQKQNEHIPGTLQRNNRLALEATGNKSYSSYFNKDVDVQGLIRNSVGTGEVIFKNGKIFEYVQASEPIGMVYNEGLKKYLPSSRLKIIYAKKGIHGYPVKDWRRHD